MPGPPLPPPFQDPATGKTFVAIYAPACIFPESEQKSPYRPYYIYVEQTAMKPERPSSERRGSLVKSINLSGWLDDLDTLPTMPYTPSLFVRVQPPSYCQELDTEEDADESGTLASSDDCTKLGNETLDSSHKSEDSVSRRDSISSSSSDSSFELSLRSSEFSDSWRNISFPSMSSAWSLSSQISLPHISKATLPTRAQKAQSAAAAIRVSPLRASVNINRNRRYTCHPGVFNKREALVFERQIKLNPINNADAATKDSGAANRQSAGTQRRHSRRHSLDAPPGHCLSQSLDTPREDDSLDGKLQDLDTFFQEGIRDAEKSMNQLQTNRHQITSRSSGPAGPVAASALAVTPASVSATVATAPAPARSSKRLSTGAPRPAKAVQLSAVTSEENTQSVPLAVRRGQQVPAVLALRPENQDNVVIDYPDIPTAFRGMDSAALCITPLDLAVSPSPYTMTTDQMVADLCAHAKSFAHRDPDMSPQEFLDHAIGGAFRWVEDTQREAAEEDKHIQPEGRGSRQRSWTVSRLETNSPLPSENVQGALVGANNPDRQLNTIHEGVEADAEEEEVATDRPAASEIPPSVPCVKLPSENLKDWDSRPADAGLSSIVTAPPAPKGDNSYRSMAECLTPPPSAGSRAERRVRFSPEPPQMIPDPADVEAKILETANTILEESNTTITRPSRPSLDSGLRNPQIKNVRTKPVRPSPLGVAHAQSPAPLKSLAPISSTPNQPSRAKMIAKRLSVTIPVSPNPEAIAAPLRTPSTQRGNLNFMRSPPPRISSMNGRSPATGNRIPIYPVSVIASKEKKGAMTKSGISGQQSRKKGENANVARAFVKGEGKEKGLKLPFQSVLNRFKS